MLSDFLILEHYYDLSHSTLFFEDVSRRYGSDAVRKALKEGQLACHRVSCGPDAGRAFFFLTEKGRQDAVQSYRIRH